MHQELRTRIQSTNMMMNEGLLPPKPETSHASERHRTSIVRLTFALVVAVLCTWIVVAQDSARVVPTLSLDEAITIAISCNRSLKVATLEIDKSKWQIAEVKTKRLPSFSGTILGSQLLNEVSFSFPAGAFGSYPGLGPVPSTDTKITTPRQPIAYVVGQATQPLSQLYKIHLGVRATELNAQLTSEKASRASRSRS